MSIEDTGAAEVAKIQEQTEEQTKQSFKDPYELLATFPNAPNKTDIEHYKAQSPNGIIRLFAIGPKRVYLVRGLSGIELAGIQGQIPSNLGAGLADEVKAMKIDAEVAIHGASKGVIWTSTTKDGKLSPEQVRGGSAGLPSTLFTLVSYLSDFLEPAALDAMSIEL